MRILKPKFWDKKNLISISLFPFSIIYKFFLELRNILIKEHEFTIPLICVGNVYVGGTGKTPLSIKICKELAKNNFKPVLIRKFYRKHKDEYEMILEHNVKLITNTNRKKCIIDAIKNNFNVAVLDDGYQDISVKKNLSIICFNNNQLIGNGYMLPAGPLRDSFNSINKADIIVINGEKNDIFEEKILKIKKNINIFYANYVPENLNHFTKKKLLAVAGIGEPENFFKLLRKYDIKAEKELSYPDHYDFKKNDIEYIEQLASERNLEIITTEKNYQKIKKDNFKYLKLDLRIEREEEFINLLSKVLK